MSLDHYAVAPGVGVAVGGHPTARAHFRAEYGAALVRTTSEAPTPVHVHVHFATRLPRGPARGGHKTVRWAVQLGHPDARPLEARLVLAGAPRRFALSLVQGFVIEPLVSLVAAEAGHVLLPAAALEHLDGAVVVMGRSRSGKTSVVARAVAGGQATWGDDQVLLDAEATVRSWPRRLRVYPDLRHTAPSAFATLPRAERARLRRLAVLSAASGGWIAPSLPLPLRDLGQTAPPGPAPARRLVLVERGGSASGLLVTPLPEREVVDQAAEVLREQRARLRGVLDPGWAPLLARTEEGERVLLRGALAAVPAERWTVPRSWTAPVAVAALADRLGVPR